MRKKGKFVQESHMDVFSQNWPLLLSANISGRNEIKIIDFVENMLMFFNWWIISWDFCFCSGQVLAELESGLDIKTV